MSFSISFILCLLCILWPNSYVPSFSAADIRQVIVPVADLRSEPKDAAPDTYAHDPLQESQLVFGERVRVHEIRGDWALVEALDQSEFTHKKKWEGYPGWMRVGTLGASSPAPSAGLTRAVVRRSWAAVHSGPSRRSGRLMRIPIGSHVEVGTRNGRWYPVTVDDGRSGWISRCDVSIPGDVPSVDFVGGAVWRNARSFLGVPYYWGGLSAHAPEYNRTVTGVDCSGLIHLCYRVAGVPIPRDSHEQWMTSTRLKRSDLRRGDLVFLANAAKPDRVVHVMMYAGGEFLIEGPGTGLAVRRVTFKKKLGRRLSGIESGDTVGEKIVYFGRLAGQKGIFQ